MSNDSVYASAPDQLLACYVFELMTELCCAQPNVFVGETTRSDADTKRLIIRSYNLVFMVE